MEMKTILAVAVLAVGTFAGSAQAGPLYAADNTLYSINAATGASSAIASNNSNFRLGLAYNGVTNTMYSLGSFTGSLYTLNLANGATSMVGDNNFSMTGLAFSNDYQTLYSMNGNGGSLLRVNPTNGAGVVIGGGSNQMLDLSMNSAGVLFGGGFGGIGTFNTSTGAFSRIGGSLSWTAIAFDENDVLYGIELNGDALYRIDTANGNATLVGGRIGGDVRGMDFAVADAPANDIPEPASLALFGLGALGIAAMRRRKTA